MFIPYVNNNYFFGFSCIPNNCDMPPTVYSILNAIVNGTKELDDYTKIKDLAKEGHTTIFDFDYTLSDKISKDDFEILILNHYLMRRIGFETVTAFKIALFSKLNEIMPLYNKMFDAIQNWDIFKDGEKVSRYGADNREISTKSDTENKLENSSNTNNTSDRRYSNMPQNHLENIREGAYVTDYNYDTNNSNDNSKSNGTSNNTTNTNDDNIYNETIERSPADKINIIKEIQTNINSIYTMIFNDLDDLFYGLV